MATIASLAFINDQLTIIWANGAESRLAALWLRDNCQLACCRDNQNGQRLINITDIPRSTTIASVTASDAKVTIRFAPDNHISEFETTWLFDNCYCLNKAFDDRGEKSKTLWMGPSAFTKLPNADYADFCWNSATQKQALQAVAEYGFVILNNVPVKPGSVVDVISHFGFVRETNYGKLFDVQTEVDPNNLAFTNLGLGGHLDNPYRNPVPGLQLLHCLENSAQGGETMIQDGFMAASILRDESTQNFSLLSKTAINFRFQNKSVDLHALATMIELNVLNEIVTVRFNNRSIAPLTLPETSMLDYYTAYRHLAEIFERTDLQICFKLNLGQLLLFDNTRILHARKAFSSAGRRHLQGAYSDLDGLYSKLNILKSSTNKS